MKRVAAVAGADLVSTGVLAGGLGERQLDLVAPAETGSAANEVVGGMGQRHALDALVESLHEVVLGSSGILRVGHNTVVVVLGGSHERHREVCVLKREGCEDY